MTQFQIIIKNIILTHHIKKNNIKVQDIIKKEENIFMKLVINHN